MPYAVNIQLAAEAVLDGHLYTFSNDSCNVNPQDCTISYPIENCLSRDSFHPSFHVAHAGVAGNAGAGLYKFHYKFTVIDHDINMNFDVNATTLEHTIITHTNQESNAVASLLWLNICIGRPQG